MRVLMITLGYGKGGVGKGYFGGTELGAERLRNWLIKNDIDVDVVGSGSPQKNFNVPVGLMWKIFWAPQAFLKCLLAMFKKPDIIYSRYATFPLLIGFFLKKIFRKPLVVSVHGGDMRKSGFVENIIYFMMRSCDKVICYDNFKHIRKLNRFNPIIIPNGIYIGHVKEKKDKIKRIVYVGGKRKIKGYDDILRLASEKYLWEDGKLELHIYGEFSEENENGVYYHPYTDDIFRKGDLFILPSYDEGVPTSLLEAMASEMFVIASYLDFTIKALELQYLFKPGDIDAMREMIEAYDTSERSFFEMQKNNRNFVIENYSMDIVGEKWKHLLKSLVED
jgi:glycosyltransferase involved in cell wall biosynthesis